MHNRFCGRETGQSLSCSTGQPCHEWGVQYVAAYPRHCERSEAIHSAASGEVDCFAALAMTAGWIGRFPQARRKILRRLLRSLAIAQEAAEQASSALARDQVDVADQLGAALAPLQHDLAAVKRFELDAVGDA